MRQRPGRVVPDHRLDRDAVGGGVDRGRNRVAVIIDPDRDKQPGAGRIGHERDLAVEGDLVRGDGRAGGRRPDKATARIDRPAPSVIARRARRDVCGTQLAGRDSVERLVAGGIEDRRRGHQPE